MLGAKLVEERMNAGADLYGAKYNKHTTFPDGFDPEAARIVLKE